MRTRSLVAVVVVFIAVFMAGTLTIALVQDDVGWGWWWVVPVAGAFILVIGGFRILVQRSAEAAEAADRAADHQGSGSLGAER